MKNPSTTLAETTHRPKHQFPGQAGLTRILSGNVGFLYAARTRLVDKDLSSTKTFHQRYAYPNAPSALHTRSPAVGIAYTLDSPAGGQCKKNLQLQRIAGWHQPCSPRYESLVQTKDLKEGGAI